jgi:tetratricopeptide (TPR) repeat protein
MFIIAGAFVFLYRQLRGLSAVAAPAGALAPKPGAKQLAGMLTYADRLYAEKKWLAAEKAYLGVLKVDHKNVTAYSHLGIIYSMQKNFPDALECFTITTRLRPSATSFQNLALAYFDNKNYMKSVAAFEKSIMFEPNAQRYIGLSKAQKQLHNSTASLNALEKAAALDPSERIQQLLTTARAQAKAPTTRRNSV